MATDAHCVASRHNSATVRARLSVAWPVIIPYIGISLLGTNRAGMLSMGEVTRVPSRATNGLDGTIAELT
eukprot:16001897-Heterocapsa_arctica.AAC.1